MSRCGPAHSDSQLSQLLAPGMSFQLSEQCEIPFWETSSLTVVKAQPFLFPNTRLWEIPVPWGSLSQRPGGGGEGHGVFL